MPRGIPNAKPAQPFGGKGDHDNDGTVGGAHEAVDMENIGHTPAVTEKVEAAKPKLVPVRLLRNYRPESDVFEVVGYHKEAIIRKRPDGKMVTVEEGGFFKETGDDGEIVGAPPAMVGTGFSDRLNVGTVVRLPRDEAKRARDLKIGELELDD